jgi:hypothetical protein
MTFAGYDPLTGIAEWDSSANWSFSTALQGNQSVATQFIIEFEPFTGLSQGFIGSGFVVPTTKGAADIAGNPAESVLQVLANFQAQFRFQTNGTPVLDFYNSFNNVSGTVQSSTSFGFWSSAVPEPGSFAFLATGLLGLALVRRSKAVGKLFC